MEVIVAMGFVFPPTLGQELLGLPSFVDKSRIYVDFVAGTLVLVNSLVMLAGPAEYARIFMMYYAGAMGVLLCVMPCGLVIVS